MNDLPTPMSRIELYLAVAAGMTGVTVPEEPMSRLELFLAYIAGDTSVELPTPLSLTELWLNYVATGTTSDEMKLEGAYYIGGQKVDVRFFAVAGGMDDVTAPAPQNRTEEYWARIAEIRPIHGVLKYATGINIVLTDVVSGLESLENIYGDTTQQTYTGKNLWGGTFVLGGIDTVNGDNFTASNRVRTVEYTSVQANTIYSLSGVEGSRIAFFYDSAKNYLGYVIVESQQTSGSFTTIADTAFVRWVIIQTNTDIQEQLELGSTATSYEPYVGGTPAPNPDYPQPVNVVTGTQNVWVHGKNLLNPSAMINGYVLATGGINTNAATGDMATPYFIPVEPNSSVTFTIYKTTSSYASWFGLCEYTEANETSFTGTRQVDQTAGITSATFTVGANTHFVRVSARNMQAATEYQLEYGSTKTSYEAYTNHDYDLDLASKNLFDETTITAGDITGNYTNIRISSRQVYYLKAGTYTISSDVSSDYNWGITTNQVGAPPLGSWPTMKYDPGWQTSASLPFTFTLSEAQEGWLCLNFKRVNGGNLTVEDIKQFHWQLQKGSDATTYQPYYTPIELAKIGDYQDYIYKSGSDWYVHKEIRKTVFDGDEDWKVPSSMQGTNTSVFFVPNTVITPNLPALCNSFTYYTGAYYTDINGQFCTIWGGSTYLFRIYNTIASTAAEFKTWLSSNNMTLYDILATPTDTQITDSTLIGQLNALDSAVLPKPNATLTVTPTGTNLAGALKISYMGEEE